MFIEHKDVWEHLLPTSASESAELAKEFFSCVAAVMSNQLRGMVINSLSDYLEFFEIHIVSISSSGHVVWAWV